MTIAKTFHPCECCNIHYTRFFLIIGENLVDWDMIVEQDSMHA
jgi:hypothetical protein